MMGITGAFSSLGINEPTRNTFQRVKMSRNFSLPNLFSGDKLTISPSFIRNNYREEDIENNDQPIDFSKKYCETKISEKRCAFNKVVKSYNNTFTMYAETDLDQPTDYSLRYAEDDSDSDGCNKINKTTENVEFVQDTIKTYCTEDTPYETPFNFSTSTSMSDLRIDDKPSIENKLDSEPKHVNITDTKEKGVKSSFSSGLMSPEKPVNYCEEGTPGYFSRVASCGSLNSIPVSDQSKQEVKEDNCEKKESRRLSKYPTETTKAVKFEEVVNYAEETPLMFSRSSSLASLDSIEQHSIHDDRSSVISDFSRLTSGLISPSELPDSPSQTIPPSPKPRKNSLVFPQIPTKKTEHESPPPNVPKSSVFEDMVKKFKMESSPLQFSTATSLSSLIEDDTDGKNPEKNEGKSNNNLSESSEDEDILAACINIGMQNNRYSQQKSNSPPPNDYKFSEIVNSPQHLSIGNSLKTSVEVVNHNSVRKTDVTSDSIRTYCTEDTPAILSQAGSNSDLSILSMHVESKIANNTNDDLGQGQQLKVVDDVKDYQEVDKIDNLDGLEAEKGNLSGHSSFSLITDESESEQALLQECILAGMPKATAGEQSEKNVESSDDEEDKNILADCINSGMKNNRYSQVNYNVLSLPAKNGKTGIVNDHIKSYYTEGTPAGLSHAGSSSDLSILSAQANEKVIGEKDDLSDFNFSEDEDEKLLMECVRYGMAKIAGSAPANNEMTLDGRNYLQHDNAKKVSERRKVDLNISVEDNVSDEDDDQSFSSLTDDESEEALLQECILAGMPKPRRPQPADTLTASEKALLQQCILEGMKNCRISAAKKPPPPPSDTSDLTEAERALLRQCILAGMPKNKNLSVGGPSRESSSSTSELTESERLLLQQCILAGMPKAKGAKKKTMKEERGEGVGHTCCIHCPKNNRGRGNHGGVRNRRRYRDGRDILYVTSQILAIKKEIIDRSHEEWV